MVKLIDFYEFDRLFVSLVQQQNCHQCSRETTIPETPHRLWDNYCVKNKRCVDKCQGVDGKGYHHGHCELWTCVCCKKKGEDDGIVAPPSRAQLGPEQ